jgi:hypothetical protein
MRGHEPSSSSNRSARITTTTLLQLKDQHEDLSSQRPNTYTKQKVKEVITKLNV